MKTEKAAINWRKNWFIDKYSKTAVHVCGAMARVNCEGAYKPIKITLECNSKVSEHHIGMLSEQLREMLTNGEFDVNLRIEYEQKIKS